MSHHHFVSPADAGWQRVAPRTWRRPDGRVHEFPIGDHEAVLHLAPEITALLEQNRAALIHLAKRFDHMANIIDDAIATLTSTVADVVDAVHAETAKLAAGATAPAGMPMADVEASAKKIAALNDSLRRVADEARASLVDPAPAVPPPVTPPPPPVTVTGSGGTG